MLTYYSNSAIKYRVYKNFVTFLVVANQILGARLESGWEHQSCLL